MGGRTVQRHHTRSGEMGYTLVSKKFGVSRKSRKHLASKGTTRPESRKQEEQVISARKDKSNKKKKATNGKVRKRSTESKKYGRRSNWVRTLKEPT